MNRQFPEMHMASAKRHWTFVSKSKFNQWVSVGLATVNITTMVYVPFNQRVSGGKVASGEVPERHISPVVWFGFEVEQQLSC